LALQWSGIAADGVGEGIGVGIGVGEGVGTRIEGRCVGRGCAASVVVFFDGSNAVSGMASRFTGHIPIFRKADWIFVGFNALTHAAW
jgi:hypothetical protein